MTRNRRQPWATTPLIESPHLSKLAGCRILLKLDNLQPSGSFKSRGIGNYLLRRIQESEAEGKNPHFYASSGGNAGIACVVAARSLGYNASVVVPTTTSPALIARLYAEGVTKVVQHGQSVMDADKYLKAVVLPADPDGVYVPPFDHQDVWDGNSTVMQEIAVQMEGEKPDAVVCSVGGGGLMNGVVQQLDKLGWSDDVKVVAMETDGADSLNRSLLANEIVTLPKITSQARSLGVATVSKKTFEYAQRPQVVSAVLPDGEAARGCLILARHERLMVELTAGIAIVLCENRQLDKLIGRELTGDSTVVLLVCGGNDISVEMLMKWQELYGVC
ncbi:tryptophan synthase beta subunit-like PLP-dependent enzyme [Ilyonectria robusta]|uniref:tryptophan synthase beta subunit-like PLP-dependent enzyme n=1 Tax=Ilyonectria robusta TaxID=1079257 RepID=UPI001E8CA19E|nr:tryptophan synthase beta subunit-like PLP-dependent enzyme [Ilyonectria robusta]KAH8729299.1 tryptophan synthase beta subunit-like PLP-dependent enzyme [Ilyonectria robusta]